MKKRFIIAFMLVFSAVLLSCSKTREQKNDNPSESDSASTVTTTTCDTTTTAATTTSATTTTTTASDGIIPTFSTTCVELPKDFSQTREEAVECFDYSKFGEYDNLILLAVDGEYAYFEKVICDFDDESDVYIYKFNLSTGETTLFDGYIPDYNTAADDYAFVNGRIIGFVESTTERICFDINTQQNCVDVIESEPIDWSKDSFRFTHPVNDEEYAEIWFDMGSPFQTYHVKIYDKNGNGREVITNKYNKGSERYVYTVNDNKIYECVQTNDMTEAYLNIYDTNGNLLSSTYLEEITKAIREKDVYASYNDYVAYVHAFGDYVGVSVNGKIMGNDQYYIYNLSENTLTIIEDLGCYYVDTYKSIGAETENHIFYTHNNNAEGFEYNIYCFDNEGEITALAESAEGRIVSDGKTVVFLRDDILYRIVL